MFDRIPLLLIYFVCFALIGLVITLKRNKILWLPIFVALLILVALNYFFLLGQLHSSFLEIMMVLLYVLLVISLVVFFIFGIIVTQKSLGRKGLIILLAHVALCSVVVLPIYWSLYPRDGFYIDEFKLHTGYELPDSAEIREKDGGYFSFTGDYYSEAIIKLTQPEFEKLESTILSYPDDAGCVLQGPTSYLGVVYNATDCWGNGKKLNNGIAVSLFRDESTLYYYYIKN